MNSNQALRLILIFAILPLLNWSVTGNSLESMCEDIIAQDDFEDGWGIWVDDGDDAAKVQSQTNANSGKYSIRIADDVEGSSTSTVTLDLEGYTQLTLGFSFYPIGNDDADDIFYLEYSVDRGQTYVIVSTWVFGIDFENKVHYDEIVEIGATFTTETKFRFRTSTTNNLDRIYLDDIVVSACPPTDGGEEDTDIEYTCAIVDQEDFESGWGMWIDAGADAARAQNQSHANSGIFSIRIQDDTEGGSMITSASLDMTGYDAIRIDFSYYPLGNDDPGDEFFLEISIDDGTSYTTIEEWNYGDEYSNENHYNEQVTFEMKGQSGVRLRFRSHSTNDNDRIFLDDIQIQGCHPDQPPEDIDIIYPSGDGICDASLSFTFGGFGGPFDVVLIGGEPPISTTQVGVSGIVQFMDLCPGTYTLVMTNASGCGRTITAEIIGCVNAVTIDAQVEQISCFGAKDGSIQLNVTGGSPPYIYDWAYGSDTPERTGLSPATYAVQVIDAEGCQASASYDIMPLSLISVTSREELECTFTDGNLHLILDVSGGAPPYIFDWSTGDMTNSIVVNDQVRPFVIITDDNGCTTNDLTIVYNISTIHLLARKPIATITPTCEGENSGAIELDFGEFDIPQLVYQWSHGPSTKDVEGLSGGNYFVEISELNSPDCSETFNYVVEVSSLSVSADISNLPCRYFEVDITTTGGVPPYQFLWIDPSGEQRETENYFSILLGLHTFQVVDAQGCIITRVYEYTENSEPIFARAEVISHACHGQNTGSISVTQISGGTPPYRYNWFRERGAWSGFPPASQSISGLEAGKYGVIVSDSYGCISEQVVEIKIGSGPIVTIEKKVDVLFCTECFVEECSDDGEIQITVSGVNNYEVSWTGPNGFESSEESLTNLEEGRYYLTVKSSDAVQCEVQKVINIDVCEYEYAYQDRYEPCESFETAYPLHQILLNRIDNAMGSCMGAIDIDFIPENNFTVHYWTGPDGYKSDLEDLKNLCAGEYCLNILHGCDQPELFCYEIFDCDFDIELSSFRSDFNNESTGYLTITIRGNSGPYDIQWSNNQNGITNSNLSSGNYEVVVTDANGCQSTSSFYLPYCLSSDFNIELDATATRNCAIGFSSLTANVVAGSGNVEFTWEGFDWTYDEYFETLYGTQITQDLLSKRFLNITTLQNSIPVNQSGFFKVSARNNCGILSLASLYIPCSCLTKKYPNLFIQENACFNGSNGKIKIQNRFDGNGASVPWNWILPNSNIDYRANGATWIISWPDGSRTTVTPNLFGPVNISDFHGPTEYKPSTAGTHTVRVQDPFGCVHEFSYRFEYDNAILEGAHFSPLSIFDPNAFDPFYEIVDGCIYCSICDDASCASGHDYHVFEYHADNSCLPCLGGERSAINCQGLKYDFVVPEGVIGQEILIDNILLQGDGYEYYEVYCIFAPNTLTLINSTEKNNTQIVVKTEKWLDCSVIPPIADCVDTELEFIGPTCDNYRLICSATGEVLFEEFIIGNWTCLIERLDGLCDLALVCEVLKENGDYNVISYIDLGQCGDLDLEGFPYCDEIPFISGITSPKYPQLVDTRSTAKKNEVNMYPNPYHSGHLSFGNIDMRLGYNVFLFVWTVNGSLALSKKNYVIENNSLDFDLPDLSDGLYFVELIASNNIYNFKLLVINE